MTAQFAEDLLYEGESVAMCTNPLGDYFALGGFNPRFDSNCTALWRGYVGQWEIVGGRLYLVGLHGTLEDGTVANLETVFPGFPDRVFAHWYTGTIRIPQGGLLKYVHMGYGSVYERDLFLYMERGVVRRTQVRHNGEAGSDGPRHGYGVGAVTVLPRRDPGEGV